MIEADTIQQLVNIRARLANLVTLERNGVVLQRNGGESLHLTSGSGSGVTAGVCSRRMVQKDERLANQLKYVSKILYKTRPTLASKEEEEENDQQQQQQQLVDRDSYSDAMEVEVESGVTQSVSSSSSANDGKSGQCIINNADDGFKTTGTGRKRTRSQLNTLLQHRKFNSIRFKQHLKSMLDTDAEARALYEELFANFIGCCR